MSLFKMTVDQKKDQSMVIWLYVIYFAIFIVASGLLLAVSGVAAVKASEMGLPMLLIFVALNTIGMAPKVSEQSWGRIAGWIMAYGIGSFVGVWLVLYFLL